MKIELIDIILEKQRTFFAQGKTKNINFRIEQLEKLKKSIIEHEEKIINALHADLGKPSFVAYSTEIYFCLEEINNVLKNIKAWARPARVKTGWTLFPASSFIFHEPLGTVLIIATWNYPFQLNIMPLIGAMAAGNCAILKPSEFATNTTNLLADLISNTFDSSYITLVKGDGAQTKALIEKKFDYIFFTGSSRVGKLVMQAAATNLTPVTLELGGKSPCIVDSTASIETSAKRILAGKFANAGQSCIAPDYLFVDKKIKEELLEQFSINLKKFYGTDPYKSQDYSKIINRKHFSRLINLLEEAKILIGGEHNIDKLFIEPTIVEIESKDHTNPLMHEEIFGPILPIISYENVDEAISYIKSHAKPIAIYCFSRNKSLMERIVNETSSGGVCINHTTLQIANLNLPFGGVGQSGFGRYHGKAGFLAFSNPKSIAKTSFFIDTPTWYPPYDTKFFTWLKKYLAWISR
jgi:aldehyde dehydrogenase (NAD+)